MTRERKSFYRSVFRFLPGFGRCLVYRKQTCLLKRYANQVYLMFSWTNKSGGAVAEWLVRSTQIGRSGVEPWPGHCVAFLGKTLYSYKWVPAN